MEEKDQPPPYPGTGTGNETGAGTGSYGANYQTEYSNLGYQTGSQPLAYPPPPQPYIQQQAMMNNTVVVGGMGGIGRATYQSVPQDYTMQAWIACLCCFCPTGLLAILKASKSRDALARDDFLAAHTAATSARQMVRISFVIGILSVVITVAIFGIYFGLVLSAYRNNNLD